MSTITRERLQWLANISGRDDIDDIDGGEIRELARIALASLEAEAVAWRYRFVHTPKSEEHGSPFTTDWVLAHSEEECNPSDCFERQPLYITPPAPVAMKDHQIRALVNELRDIAVEYYGTQQLRERIAKTVRAAMLQGTEPVSNRDELPDGWVACSERMPDEAGDIIVVSDGIVMSGVSYSRKKGFYLQALEYDADEPVDDVTHWMTLPAAPQQEAE